MKNLTKSQQEFYEGKEKYLARFSKIREEGIKQVEELMKQPISDEELDRQIAEMFEVHGQKNSNKPRSKK